MKTFIKKIDKEGNIEIQFLKNINAGNDFDSLLAPPDDVCIKYEEINIFDLLEENKKLKDQIKIYEDPEDLTLMFMYCDIEAKDKIKELKNQLKKCKEDNNELRKDKLECYMKNTTILTSLNKFIEHLEKRLKEIKYAKKAAGSYESNYDYLGGKKNMTEEILTEFENMVEEIQKTERN